jgi:hypothetical protein
VKRKVLNQVTRYFREMERYEDFRVADAAGESQYLYDDKGNVTGVNVVFSCAIEPKGKGRSST